MSKPLGNLEKGLLFVISAPAGTGKTTLAKMLKDEFDCVKSSVSYTTRKPRPKERDGVDYHFIGKEQFERKIESGDFLEHAKVFEDYYGTEKKAVEDLQTKRNHVLLVIDTQGALEVRKKMDAILIFINPPSIEELERRLRNRKTETKSIVKERLSWAQKEMEVGKTYDHQIVNDDLNTAYQTLRSILIDEERKRLNK